MTKAVAVLAIWGLATAAGLLVAWQTHVGSVVFAVSQRHGVHVGDLVGFFVAYVWATVLTIAVVGTPPPERR